MRVSRRWVVLGAVATLTAGLLPTPAAAEPAPAGPPTLAEAVEIALDHVRANAAAYDLGAADVAELAVTSSYKSSHNGVTHVNLGQQYVGLDVFGAHGTVNVGPDGAIVFVGQSWLADLAVGASGGVGLAATEAVEAAAAALDLDEPEDLEVVASGGGSTPEVIVSDGGISEADIPARLGWQPTAAGLRLAWQVTIDAVSEANLWNATVDAQSGALLEVEDWTSHDTFESLQTLNRAGSGRAERLIAQTHAGTVYPTPPTPAIDGSSLRIYRIPNESPNDDDRQLVTNPADALGSPYGWFDTNGVPGPEFTITRGNNVHAYLDQDSSNSPDFGDTDGGPGLTFDFPIDLDEHAQAYRDAVVTNLFYGCNLVHDITYRYGFDEAADNFQATNYGGGGNGDYVRCEAADGNGTNNANFSTPSAGGTPRMQMYLWPGNQLGSQNLVTVGADAYGAGWARFGPPAPSAGITGALFDAGNGCAPADYAANPGGAWIAIVVGGTTGCQPIQKAREADAAGAAAIIMSTGTSSTGIIASNSGGMNAASPEIPAVLVSTANGTAIRASMPASATVAKHPDHPGIRDGDFDMGIVMHEYGHGLSNRLTGGPGINCLSGNEQAGEGWSDFLAMVSLIDPTLDDPDGTRGLVPYVLFDTTRAGNGLRPRPYSRTMELQPFTYDSIKSNGWLSGSSLALPHGLGHGWTAVLWDMTWDLIDKHGFNPNIYEPWHTGGNNRSMQYVIDGLKMQGCGPGLVVARDAIIASGNLLSGGTPGVDAEGRTIAVDGEDTCMLWASFARRGLGYSAVQGTTNRNDNDEAFDTHPDCRRGFQVPVHNAYGTLNDVIAGDAVPLKFTADGYTGLDVLFSNSPYSRQVDCDTLATVDPDSPFITPRPYPVAAVNPGNSKLSISAQGRYNYPWLTSADWAGTCREMVMTRDDGRQHRAFFRFLAAEEVTG